MRELPRVLLSETAHRPFPLPTGSWVQRQSWNDFLFCHWPIPAAVMRERVAPELDLDLWDGVAWLGIIPFHMTGVTLRFLPDIPGFSDFPELNVRTYVRVGDRPGVHFLSLDAHQRLAVFLARRWYGLPYHLADMGLRREGDVLHYRSRRRRGMGTYEARYRPLGTPAPARPGTFEHWLTERYALFLTDRRGRVWHADVHHRPWPVQPAELEIVANTMAEANGLSLPDTPPHVLYASKVDVVCWGPRCKAVPRSA